MPRTTTDLPVQCLLRVLCTLGVMMQILEADREDTWLQTGRCCMHGPSAEDIIMKAFSKTIRAGKYSHKATKSLTQGLQEMCEDFCHPVI